MPATDYQGTPSHSHSNPFSSFGRSLLSLRRDAPASSSSAAAAAAMPSGRHLAALLTDLRNGDGEGEGEHIEFLSAAWIRRLLETFLACQDEFRAALSLARRRGAGGLAVAQSEKLATEFGERAVKALDVLNAARDGVDQARRWERLAGIAASILDSAPGGEIHEGQLRRARKALADLSALLADDAPRPPRAPAPAAAAASHPSSPPTATAPSAAPPPAHPPPAPRHPLPTSAPSRGACPARGRRRGSCRQSARACLRRGPTSQASSRPPTPWAACSTSPRGRSSPRYPARTAPPRCRRTTSPPRRRAPRSRGPRRSSPSKSGSPRKGSARTGAAPPVCSGKSTHWRRPRSGSRRRSTPRPCRSPATARPRCGRPRRSWPRSAPP
ncbi:hypothetical protein PR202_gb16332 [Eleusine coracana subsp. coracana]|uniref:Uncharacterized protein n=1 Tax=Eleusine coracana subsp. coracana TaxID=191504 RepID=A0AAV5F1V5_ELECO|nr:hypothetical protein PR202_gb16332 [Eleusine coracana subsp. coracana]